MGGGGGGRGPFRAVNLLTYYSGLEMFYDVIDYMTLGLFIWEIRCHYAMFRIIAEILLVILCVVI